MSFEIFRYTLLKCRPESGETSVRIPIQVRRIGLRAFADCRELKEISIPEGVEEIGECAFEHCAGLEKIIIPESMTLVESRAFQDCSALHDVIIREGLSELSERMFLNCTSLKNINLPQSLRIIGGKTFENCKNLEEIRLPGNLARIGGRAFENCSSLKNIRLSPSIEVYPGAFRGCTSLTAEIGNVRMRNYPENNPDFVELISIINRHDYLGVLNFYNHLRIYQALVSDYEANHGENEQKLIQQYIIDIIKNFLLVNDVERLKIVFPFLKESDESRLNDLIVFGAEASRKTGNSSGQLALMHYRMKHFSFETDADDENGIFKRFEL